MKAYGAKATTLACIGRRTFLDFLPGGIGEKWIDCMNSYGMASGFQQAILDPEFNDIRLQETCAYWIKDTIQIRHDALLEVREASMGRESALKKTAAASLGHARTSSRGDASSSSSRVTTSLPNSAMSICHG
ncbi:hypothetical protein LLEC1_00943 [Akanthomyces lecanii]|uniref:Uncharacterized protein n=1 Tax=Cordyceps confragosa TaxID=2714763 RepID=A0A179IIN7_CORDF|nr:hypothetical protein LLEC1_00943 [Akanthomyces lecanii]